MCFSRQNLSFYCSSYSAASRKGHAPFALKDSYQSKPDDCSYIYGPVYLRRSPRDFMAYY